MTSVHLFETPIGHCGIAWNDTGIVRFELPCGSAAKTETRIMKYLPDATVVDRPSAAIAHVVEKIQRHLSGECDIMGDVPVDISYLPPFTRKVYRALRNVRPGETLTYGELAKKIGSPRSSRAVGRAMAKNPIPLIIPCHRVLPADGSLGNFSSAQGPKLKAKLLSIEKHA